MKEFFLAFFAVVGIIVVVALLMALPTMWLWNWLIPELLGLPTINFCIH